MNKTHLIIFSITDTILEPRACPSALLLSVRIVVRCPTVFVLLPYIVSSQLCVSIGPKEYSLTVPIFTFIFIYSERCGCFSNHAIDR